MTRRHYRRRRRSRGGLSLGGNNNIIWLGLAAVVAYGIWKSGALKSIIGGAAAAAGGGAGAPDLPDCPNVPSTGEGCDGNPAQYLAETGKPCPAGCD